MNTIWILNLGGLALATIAAVLMYYFPPKEVTQYTSDGAPLVQWAGEPTPEGKAKASIQQRMAKLAPAILAVGFCFQLFAALASGYSQGAG